MRNLCVLLVLSCVNLIHSQELENTEYSREFFDDLIEKINSANANWKAGYNFDENVHKEQLVGSLALAEDFDKNRPVRCHKFLNTSVTEQKVGMTMNTRRKAFNGLKEWKHCKSVGYVWNQGLCASDWVIAPVSSISDRICIQSKGKNAPFLSPELPLACCKTCGWGCKKGYPKEIFRYWVDHGLVTGGPYKSEEGCQPYSIQPRRKMRKYFKSLQKGLTPECKGKCTNSAYKKSYNEDLYKGYDFFSQCYCCAASELMENGPLVATFKLYEDFLAYKSGVYHHVYGKELGMLTVKVVGFNDTADPKYWIAVNSWGKQWGDDGTFKIKRGVDECLFESGMKGAELKDFNQEFYDDESSEEK